MILSGGNHSKSTYTTGFKPKQNIPESQKTEEWCKENLDWMIAMSPVWAKQSTDEFYNRYNGVIDESLYEHITKTFGIEYPADKIKNIPLMRPLISRLHSDQEERDLDFVVHTEDTDSVMEKIQNIGGKMLNDIIDIISQGGDIDQEVDKLEKVYKHEFRSELESGAYHFLMQYIYNHRLDRQFSDNFLDKLITGLEYYRVYVNRIGEDPIIEDIRPGELFYADNKVKWIKDCDWAVHPTELTPVQILDKFGERMKPKDVTELENWVDMYHKDGFHKITNINEADSLVTSGVKSGFNSSVNHKIAVYYGEWKSIRKITYVESPNKYAPDLPFIKVIPEEKVQEIPSWSRSRKSRVKVKYVQDLYRGIRIGDDKYVDLGRVSYPVRNASCPSKVYLSFNGLTYNGKVKPFSLVKETKDLEDLYKVLHFHKENLIALSGVRGSIMDLSQIPDFGTGKLEDNIKMYMYYKKFGTAFVDRNKESADTSFNQFTTYDDTMGAGLSIVLQMIEHIEKVAGRICGVPPQALGEIAPRAGKATTASALGNASLVNEYFFNEHDEFVQMALTDLVNAGAIAYKNGYKGFYMSDKRTQQIFTFNPGTALASLGVHITNKASDKRDVSELKQMTMLMARNGLVQYEDILPLFRKGSLSEITRLIEANMMKRRAQVSEQEQQLQQMQIQLQVAKEEADIAKLKAEIQKISSDIEDNKRKLALEEEGLNNDAVFDQEKLKLDAKRVDLEAKQLDMAGKSNAAEVRNN